MNTRELAHAAQDELLEHANPLDTRLAFDVGFLVLGLLSTFPEGLRVEERLQEASPVALVKLIEAPRLVQSGQVVLQLNKRVVPFAFAHGFVRREWADCDDHMGRRGCRILWERVERGRILLLFSPGWIALVNARRTKYCSANFSRHLRGCHGPWCRRLFCRTVGQPFCQPCVLVVRSPIVVSSKGFTAESDLVSTTL